MWPFSPSGPRRRGPSPARRRLSVELLEARAVPSDLCGNGNGVVPAPVEPPAGAILDPAPPLPSDPETWPGLPTV